MKNLILLSLILIGLFHFSRDDYYVVSATGNSMTPCYKEGGQRKIYPDIEPQIGEPIAIDCYAEKCHNKRLSKILKDKKDGCIWIEGCNEKSYDSRNYGWLCEKEYKILGLTTEL